MLASDSVYTITRINKDATSLLDKANYTSSSENEDERNIANALNNNFYT